MFSLPQQKAGTTRSVKNDRPGTGDSRYERSVAFEGRQGHPNPRGTGIQSDRAGNYKRSEVAPLKSHWPMLGRGTATGFFRLKFALDSATCHEDRSIQRIALGRGEKAAHPGRQPRHQWLRETAYQANRGCTPLYEPVYDPCCSICRLFDQLDG